MSSLNFIRLFVWSGQRVSPPTSLQVCLFDYISKLVVLHASLQDNCVGYLWVILYSNVYEIQTIFCLQKWLLSFTLYNVTALWLAFMLYLCIFILCMPEFKSRFECLDGNVIATWLVSRRCVAYIVWLPHYLLKIGVTSLRLVLYAVLVHFITPKHL